MVRPYVPYRSDTVNSHGDHILAVFVSGLSRKAEHSAESREQALNLIRLLLEHSDLTEIYGTRAYKRRKGIEHAPVGLLHCAIPRYGSQIVANLSELMLPLLHDNIGLDQQEKTGNTALHEALFFLPIRDLLRVVPTLLGRGANVTVTNKHGEGCLHLLLRRLTACSIPNLDRETISSIRSLLTTMILKGCGPTHKNIEGYTPIDAAMSPVAWPLFCAALREAGRDMKEELMLLDCPDEPALAGGYIEEKYEYAIERRARSITLSPRWPQIREGEYGLPKKACYLCNSSYSTNKREVPFDEFLSRVVDELEDSIHMVMYDHPPDTVCLRICDEDSCHILDYHPNGMTREQLKERSWRRHVAYLMWERGTLGE